MARQILCFDSWMFAECPVTIDYICTFYFFFLLLLFNIFKCAQLTEVH